VAERERITYRWAKGETICSLGLTASDNASRGT